MARLGTPRTLRVALAAGASLALLPATAHAATASISNEEGADVPLGAPVSVKTMAPILKLQFADTERRFSISVTGPGGVDAVQPVACLNVSGYSDLRPVYQGNGNYTVTVRTTTDAADLSCASAQTFSYQYAVDAGATVTAPKGGLLTREGEDAIEHAFGVSATAGTDIIELQVARNAKPQADGSLPGAPELVSVPATAKSAAVTFSRPGRYAVVARPRRDQALGPWSAPVYVDVYEPFDFVAAPLFKDARGPKYVIKGQVRGPVPKGAKIKVFIAKGKKGGKFVKLGAAKTRRKGRFRFRFETEETGNVRFRYRFKGSDKVARGKVTAAVKLVRVSG